MIFKETEVKEFGAMIRGIVREELANANMPAPVPRRDLIRRKEAQKLLGGISAPTIIKYEKEGVIHPVRIGGTILYDRDELLNLK